MPKSIEQVARGAREASRIIADSAGALRADVIRDLAHRIEARQGDILVANQRDVEAACAADLPTAKLQRLALSPEKLRRMRQGLVQIAELPDPVGAVTRAQELPSGLYVERVRTPLGVIAMIYEARPGVTIDAFALCFKAGNTCILKGGREAACSNMLLASLIHESLEAHDLPSAAMTCITTADRDELKQLLRLKEDIDLVIPRGGESLIQFVCTHSQIPTVQHFKGVCHAYVDRNVDVDQAIEIVASSKTSAPATCNALECVLVHEEVAPEFFPRLVQRASADGIVIRADETLRTVAPIASCLEPATSADWGCEYLDLTLAAKAVGSMEEAIAHIDRFGSNHTEAILTTDEAAAAAFRRRVKSSCVLSNASTRFNDGFQLGLGAEIGISTSRIHAYGPMGLESLTIERFVVRGSGQAAPQG
ncbi:MAG: glutamate-5-semialdehyde dehydrogenase [Phycisphaerales bacterium]|nr:glutamate-5-semialdehyde dehydrogenase [Phycisphaerales bacterium]